MESETDLNPLIEWVLGEIVYAGDDGISVSKLFGLVEAFYDSATKNDPTQRGAPAENPRGPHKPFQGVAGLQADPRPEIDDLFKARVWDALRVLPDVLVGEDRSRNSFTLQQVMDLSPRPLNLGVEPLHNEEQSSSSSAQLVGRTVHTVGLESGSGAAAFLPNGQDCRPRIYVSEDFMWQTIAGHGVDQKMLPKGEWHLLCEIAAAGARGISQPDVRRITGQDKRTIPKLSDLLHQKGYIEKRKIWVPKIGETSLLILKRYANHSTAADLSVNEITEDMEPLPGNEDWSGAFIDTETFARTISAVVKAWRTISYHGMRKKMAIHPYTWHDTKLLETLQDLKHLSILETLPTDSPTDESRLFEETFCFLRDLEEQDLSKFRRRPTSLSKPQRKVKHGRKRRGRKDYTSSEEDEEEISFVTNRERIDKVAEIANVPDSDVLDHIESSDSPHLIQPLLEVENDNGATVRVTSRLQSVSLETNSTFQPGDDTHSSPQATLQPSVKGKRRGRPPKSQQLTKVVSAAGSNLIDETQLENNTQSNVHNTAPFIAPPRRRGRPPNSQRLQKTNLDIQVISKKPTHFDSDVNLGGQGSVSPVPLKNRASPPPKSQDVTQVNLKIRSNRDENSFSNNSYEEDQNFVISESSSGLIRSTATPNHPKKRGRPPGKQNKMKNIIDSQMNFPQASVPLKSQSLRKSQKILQFESRSPSPATHSQLKTAVSTSYDDYMREAGVPGVYLKLSDTGKNSYARRKSHRIAVFKSEKLKNFQWMYFNLALAPFEPLSRTFPSGNISEAQLESTCPSSTLHGGPEFLNRPTSITPADSTGAPEADLPLAVQTNNSAFQVAFQSQDQQSPSATYISPYQKNPENVDRNKLAHHSMVNSSQPKVYKSPYAPADLSGFTAQHASPSFRVNSVTLNSESQLLVDLRGVPKSQLSETEISGNIRETQWLAKQKSLQGQFSQDELSQEQLTHKSLVNRRLSDAIQVEPSDFACILACSKDGVIGSLCLDKDTQFLRFLPARNSTDSAVTVLPVSDIKSPPTTSEPGSKPMELLISLSQAHSAEETVYRFRFFETKTALQATNTLRAKLVSAMTHLQLGNGGILPGPPKNPEKRFICEFCDATWKNREGKVYHQTKSKTSCNPSWVPPPENTLNRDRKSKAFKDVSNSKQETDATPLQDIEQVDSYSSSNKSLANSQSRSIAQETPTSLATTSPLASMMKSRPEKDGFISQTLSTNEPDNSHLKSSQPSSFSTFAPTSKLTRESSIQDQSPVPNLSKLNARRAIWPKPKSMPMTNVPFQNIDHSINIPRERRKRTADKPSYGDTQRHKDIIMSLLQANNGVFPGEDGLRIALGNVWIQKFPNSGFPDQWTCNYAARLLEEDGSIVKQHFSFKDVIGVMVTRIILTLPGTGPFDTKTLEMKENIKKIYPETYVPPSAAPSEDLRRVLAGRNARTKPADALRLQTQNPGLNISTVQTNIEFLNTQLKGTTTLNDDTNGVDKVTWDEIQSRGTDLDSDEFAEASPRKRSKTQSGKTSVKSGWTDEKRMRRSLQMKRQWKKLKAAGSTRLLSSDKFDSVGIALDQLEFVEADEEETTVFSDTPDSQHDRHGSEDVLNTSALTEGSNWRFLAAYFQDPQTGAWNQQSVKKRNVYAAVKRQIPAPITYMQSLNNPAWNYRPFGHGVRPIFARLSKRKDGWVSTESSYLTLIGRGFRPMVMPEKNVLYGPRLPPSTAKLTTRPRTTRSLGVSPAINSDIETSQHAKRKHTRRNRLPSAGVVAVDDFDDITQPQRRKRKYTRRFMISGVETSPQTLWQELAIRKEKEKSLKNGYPEVVFLAPNTQLYDDHIDEHEISQSSKTSIVSRDMTVATPSVQHAVQFQVPMILEADHGEWPDLTEWFFAEGSFCMQGWFPSAKYILQQHLPTQIESIYGKYWDRKMQADTFPTSQHECFVYELSKVTEWEQITFKDVLQIGTIAPDFIFYNHNIQSLKVSEKASMVEYQWLPRYAFTIETLPYDELDETPDATAKETPLPRVGRQRARKRQKIGNQSQHERYEDLDNLNQGVKQPSASNRTKRYPKRQQKEAQYTIPSGYFVDDEPSDLEAEDDKIQADELQEEVQDEDIRDVDYEYTYRETRLESSQRQSPWFDDGLKPKEIAKTRRQTALQNDLAGLTQVVFQDPNVAVEIDFAYDSGTRPWVAATDRTSVEIDDRIMVVVTVIRTLTGGLDRAVDWVLVARLLPEYSLTSVQSRWSILAKEHRMLLDRFSCDFQEIFLKAYEANEVPAIDYDHLLDYDWKSLIDWIMERVQSMDIGVQLMTQLPVSRDKLIERYNVRDDAQSSKSLAWQETWFSNQRSIQERMDGASSFQFTTASSQTPSATQELDDLNVAKSWARASTLTPSAVYNLELAKQKMEMIDKEILNTAVREMVNSKIIHSKYKGRPGPDRGYEMTDVFNVALRRPIQQSQFQQAAAFKSHLDTKFKAGEPARLEWTANDGMIMALTNLQAHGRVNLVGHGISMDKFGAQDSGDYPPRQTSKSRMRFEIEIAPTNKYIYDEDLEILRKLSMLEYCPPHGEKQALPLWYDIAEQLLSDMWTRVLVAVLATIAMSPGMIVADLVRTLAPAIEEWEMRLLLEWGVSIGVLTEIRPGNEGWNVDSKAIDTGQYQNMQYLARRTRQYIDVAFELALQENDLFLRNHGYGH